MLRFRTINVIAIVALLLLLVSGFLIPISPLYYLLLLIGWVFMTLLGSTQIRWNYHFTSLNCNKTISKDQVSVTFDDGPNPEFTPQVLKLLKDYDAKATFFCIGKNIEKYPSLFQEIIDQGHSVGNHTYSHANNFGFFSSEKVISELQKTNVIADKIAGLKLKLYRPAFGITNPPIKKALKVTGMRSIGWSKRSFDTTRLLEQNILKRITNNLEKGDIILLHDSSAKTVKVLEQLLLFLQTKKIQSITVDQLLEIEPYA